MASMASLATHLIAMLANLGDSSKLFAEPHSMKTGFVLELSGLRPAESFYISILSNLPAVAVEGLENSFIPQIKLITTRSKSVLSRENKKI